MTILFSVAVHEDFDSLIDMVENILRFNEGAKIILHVSASSSLEPEKIRKYLRESLNSDESVYVNETSLYSGYCDSSLVFIHAYNFFYGLKIDLQFEYFVPFASNELFIRKGLYEKIKNTKCTDFPLGVGTTDKSLLEKVKVEKNILSLINGSRTMVKCAPEGTFYRKDIALKIFMTLKKSNIWSYKFLYENSLGQLIKEIISKIDKVLFKISKHRISFLGFLNFPGEEIILPSLGKMFSVHQGKKITKTCYMNWDNDLAITIDEVKILTTCKKEFYSVKRVARFINDPVRQFIKEL